MLIPKYKLWSLALVFSTLIGCSLPLLANSNDPSAAKTICEAVKQPIDENGVEVTLDAYFKSDGYEYSFFFDDRCPLTSVTLYDAQEVIKDDVYDEFHNVPWDDLKTELPKLRVKIFGRLKKIGDTYRFDAIRYLEVKRPK